MVREQEPRWNARYTEIRQCEGCKSEQECLYVDDPLLEVEAAPGRAWLCEKCYRDHEEEAGLAVMAGIDAGFLC